MLALLDVCLFVCFYEKNILNISVAENNILSRPREKQYSDTP
jgi:hypothetical protein